MEGTNGCSGAGATGITEALRSVAGSTPAKTSTGSILGAGGAGATGDGAAGGGFVAGGTAGCTGTVGDDGG